jgi:hypothetical protein
MNPLRSVLGDNEQFAGLHARPAVASDDVRLDYQRHSGGEDKVRRGHRAARSRHNRREIAAAEAVHHVVDRGEARLLDDPRSGGEVLGASAWYQGGCDCVKGRDRNGV